MTTARVESAASLAELPAAELPAKLPAKLKLPAGLKLAAKLTRSKLTDSTATKLAEIETCLTSELPEAAQLSKLAKLKATKLKATKLKATKLGSELSTANKLRFRPVTAHDKASRHDPHSPTVSNEYAV